MNNSSKKCCSLLLCTLFLAIMATLIMTSNPVFGSRSLARPSNPENDVTPTNIKPKDVHRPRKLDEYTPSGGGDPAPGYGGDYYPPGYGEPAPAYGGDYYPPGYGEPAPAYGGPPGGGDYSRPVTTIAP
ncbi:hypothetical protein RND81_08G199900 [Saponaria officinalis]|uniref:Uncharacterized protein n=1 Tax=Saponaria officinalis TaxID=3572 RepID=A0AAW1JA52_SAPOF